MTLLKNPTECICRFGWCRDLVNCLGIIGLLISCAELGGCTTTAPERKTAESAPFISLRRGPVERYVIQAGDALDVKIFGCPELTQQHRVRPDGKISSQLVGDVQASGFTPAELDEVLTTAYTKKILNPEVAVIMRSFGEHTVFVGGEVRQPGEIPLRGRLTAVQAIFYAGGNTEEARLGSVILVRISGEKKGEIIRVDLSRATKSGGGDILLRPYDIVFVPRTAIAKVDRFVEQYINGMLPEAFQARLSYVIGLNPEARAQLTDLLP
jgi:polysaccharide export outer membrane protein